MNPNSAFEIAQLIVRRVEVEGAFLSYSQHGEDVYIQRLERFLEGKRFVDIGCNHPVQKSVTFAVYQQGWSGLNLDLDEGFAAMYAEHRPRDKFSALAISKFDGQTTAYMAPLSARSTLNSDVSDKYYRTNHHLESRTISCITLNTLMAANQQLSQRCDLLTIDVEGAERDVLSGCDFVNFRPTLIIVEAIDPHTQQPNFSLWDYILFEAGYCLATFDGLNAYFVANERNELASILHLPNNYTDNYVHIDQYKMAKALLDTHSNS